MRGGPDAVCEPANKGQVRFRQGRRDANSRHRGDAGLRAIECGGAFGYQGGGTLPDLLPERILPTVRRVGGRRIGGISGGGQGLHGSAGQLAEEGRDSGAGGVEGAGGDRAGGAGKDGGFVYGAG